MSHHILVACLIISAVMWIVMFAYIAKIKRCKEKANCSSETISGDSEVHIIDCNKEEETN